MARLKTENDYSEAFVIHYCFPIIKNRSNEKNQAEHIYYNIRFALKAKFRVRWPHDLLGYNLDVLMILKKIWICF